VRETHHQAELATGTPSKLQYAFEYTDGGGHVVMTKLQAEPGRAKTVVVQGDTGYAVTEIDTTPHRRWVGNGRTVLNNKGNPVLRYEPYFAVTPAYETAPELVETGVSPVMYYDAPGRVVRTTFPDGTLSRVEIGNWATRTFDRNDTVLASDLYAARIGGALGLAEQSAAQKTALHDSTPATAHADSQGRTIYAVAHNRFIDRLTSALTEEFYGTRSELDVEGNLLALYDPRGNAVMRYAYDQLGRQAFANRMDSGERRILHDGLGKPLYGWDAKGSRFHTVYDVLHRPSRHEVLTAAATLMVTERAEYGTDPALNENGQTLRRLEPAGVVTFDGYDFAGNLLQSTRRFVASPDGDIDWTTEAAVALDGRSFTTSSTYDALKRVVESVAPDGSRTLNHYNESNLLSGVEVGIRGGALQAFVTRIDHDAKGQRQRIVHGNAASTAFTYDPATLRVATIVTTRAADGARLQDLRYTYDPVGNISGVWDAAQQAAYFQQCRGVARWRLHLRRGVPTGRRDRPGTDRAEHAARSLGRAARAPSAQGGRHRFAGLPAAIRVRRGRQHGGHGALGGRRPIHQSLDAQVRRRGEHQPARVLDGRRHGGGLLLRRARQPDRDAAFGDDRLGRGQPPAARGRRRRRPCLVHL